MPSLLIFAARFAFLPSLASSAVRHNYFNNALTWWWCLTINIETTFWRLPPSPLTTSPCQNYLRHLPCLLRPPTWDSPLTSPPPSTLTNTLIIMADLRDIYYLRRRPSPPFRPDWRERRRPNTPPPSYGYVTTFININSLILIIIIIISLLISL